MKIKTKHKIRKLVTAIYTHCTVDLWSMERQNVKVIVYTYAKWNVQESVSIYMYPYLTVVNHKLGVAVSASLLQIVHCLINCAIDVWKV